MATACRVKAIALEYIFTTEYTEYTEIKFEKGLRNFIERAKRPWRAAK